MEEQLSSNQSEAKPLCRICYSDEEDRHSKLICPCECKGSIRFVHNSCIKEWARIAAINSADSMESLKCEICHSIFHKRRQFDNWK